MSRAAILVFLVAAAVVFAFPARSFAFAAAPIVLFLVFLWWTGVVRSPLPKDGENDRVRYIEESGPLMAEGRPGGTIGWVRFTAGLLSVEVYPGGIIAHGFRDHTILATEIDGVYEEEGFFSSKTRVEHRSPDARSPLSVFVGIDEPIAMAIRMVWAEAQGPERGQDTPG
jgi:hypothetical protein